MHDWNKGITKKGEKSMRGRRILAMLLSMAVCVSLCGCRETAPADKKI